MSVEKVVSTINKKSLTPRNIAKLIAEAASNKKANNIAVLDMRKVINFCDYFVLCSGNTDRQTKAIAAGIEEALEDVGIKIPGNQGYTDARWIVMDFGDIVVHVFEKQTREFYGLDYLWQEAKQVKLNG